MRDRVSNAAIILAVAVAAGVVGVALWSQSGGAAPFRLSDIRPDAVAVDVACVGSTCPTRWIHRAGTAARRLCGRHLRASLCSSCSRA